MTTGPFHRFTMRKGAIAPIGVAATVLACLATGLPAAQATSGADGRGTDAVLGAWAWASFTDWQRSLDAPADPDAQAGDANVANLIQIGEGYADTADAAYREKVSDGWRRYTPWQSDPTPPAVGDGEEAGHRYENEVTVPGTPGTPAIPGTPAVPGTAAIWSNFSPNKDQGPFDGPPSWPTDERGTWEHADSKDMPPGHAGPDGVYQRGNGNGSWFYRQAEVPGTPATKDIPAVPGTDPVTTTVYRWDVYAFHFEYRWSVYERTYTPGEPTVEEPPVEEPTAPAVDEPTAPAVDEPNAPAVDEPNAPAVDEPTAPAVDEPTEPKVKGVAANPDVKGAAKPILKGATATKSHGPKQPAKVGGNRSAVPLAIDAGL